MAQTIEIVRGSTNTLRVSVLDATGLPYNLGSGEKVVFGVKKEKEDEDLLITRVAEILYEGMYSIRLVPEDSMDLEPGLYYYDVGLESGTDFFPIIKPSPFLIEPNVTRRGCTVNGG